MKDLLNVNFFMEIFERLHVAIYVADRDGKMVYLNRAAKRLDHLDDDVIGKNLADIYSNTVFREGMNSPTLDALQTGNPHIYENLEWYLKDGTTVNAITSTYPVREGDDIIGVFALSEDVDRLKAFLIKHGAFKQKISYRFRNKTMKNGTQYVFDDIIGKSELMKNTIVMARRFAAKKLPVMIYGETGTGKEMFAQSIHNASPYKAGPFVPINCAAIPENLLESMLFGTVKGAFTGAIDHAGLFEKADGGSVFLDEINSMPLMLQAKILRVLQEKEVQRIGDSKTRKINCRIISATNKLPSEAVRNNELREDLYYRLSTGMVWIPSLRERNEDLSLLMDYFIEKANAELNATILSVSPDLDRLFHAYDWPGNVRELSNAIESSMNMTLDGETILDLRHLPTYLKRHFSEELMGMPNAEEVFSVRNDEMSPAAPIVHFHGNINDMVDSYEKELIQFALRATKGNLSRCGEKLGISRQSLSVKLKKHGIDPKVFKK